METLILQITECPNAAITSLKHNGLGVRTGLQSNLGVNFVGTEVESDDLGASFMHCNCCIECSVAHLDVHNVPGCGLEWKTEHKRRLIIGKISNFYVEIHRSGQ